MDYLAEIRSTFSRNKLLIAIVTFTFFFILIVSAVVAYALLVTLPGFVGFLKETIESTRGLIAIPPPYTSSLYGLIFLNNIGHFWNPVRVWVWLPLIGAFSLGYELLMNAVVIGGVISFETLTRGGAYTIAGLAPHGVLEIPAFILEFAGLARWHVTTAGAIYRKLSGREIDRPRLTQELRDALFLSLLSVALFAMAAYVETYVTPHFLGL